MTTTKQTCDVCGQRVRIQGDTTKSYVGVDAEELEKLRDENIRLVEALQKEAEEIHSGYKKASPDCQCFAHAALREAPLSTALAEVRAAEKECADYATRCLDAFDNEFGESIVGEALPGFKAAIVRLTEAKKKAGVE